MKPTRTKDISGGDVNTYTIGSSDGDTLELNFFMKGHVEDFGTCVIDLELHDSITLIKTSLVLSRIEARAMARAIMKETSKATADTSQLYGEER